MGVSDARPRSAEKGAATGVSCLPALTRWRVIVGMYCAHVQEDACAFFPDMVGTSPSKRRRYLSSPRNKDSPVRFFSHCKVFDDCSSRQVQRRRYLAGCLRALAWHEQFYSDSCSECPASPEDCSCVSFLMRRPLGVGLIGATCSCLIVCFVFCALFSESPL